MSQPTRIGVFGFYSYRNLGDNLMACLVAEQVRAAGCEPVIFCKLDDPRIVWGFESCGSVAEFVAGVDAVICGGGGLLISRPRPSDISKDFHIDLQALLDATAAKGIPVFGTSLGGGGMPLDAIVPPVRQDLVRKLRYVTLRNREDVQLLDQAGIEGEFLDDIVWSVSRKILVVPTAREGRRPKVGINLYIGHSRKMQSVRLLLQLITWIRRDIDFVFYEIHPELDGTFEAFSTNLGQPNCSARELLDIRDACQELSSADLLITTRLHCGVMAMSYGVPSIAFAGAEKTRLLYRRAARSQFFWPAKEFARFAALFLMPGRFGKLISQRQTIVPDEIMNGALAHYDRISDYCTQVRQTA
jgi:polysaccharide pyruvyl transferase WcaK-like protein